MTPIALSVVIPAYNEHDRLPRTLERLRAWRPAMFDPLEIIVVDDGSEDDTCEVARKYAKEDARLEVVPAKHGGAMHALITGYRKARYDHVGNMEADCATDPSEFERLAPYLSQADVVTGSRQLRGELPPIEGKSPLRRVLSKGLSNLVVALFRCGVYDPQIGFRIFKRKALMDALPLLSSPHDGIKATEILVKAHGLGYAVKEVPVLYTHDPASRLVPKHPYKVVARVFVAVFGVWLDAARQFDRGLLKRKPVRGMTLARALNWAFSGAAR